MEQETWVVKVEMREPYAHALEQFVEDVGAIGGSTYTIQDVAELHRRLRDELPVDAPRRLINASTEDGALVAFFVTSAKPSVEECQQLYRLTYGALTTLRRPLKFNCVKVYPGPKIAVGYLV